MNPGYENFEEYIKYKSMIKKIKTVENLDGLDINDNSTLEIYKNRKDIPNSNQMNNNKYNERIMERIEEEHPNGEWDENDINNIIKAKKRQSTITYSQRMLKKADNLTKFNRKNHSEGNKHITNNDL